MRFDCAEFDGFSRPKLGYYNEKDYPLDVIAAMFWKKHPSLKGASVRHLDGRGMRGVLMDEYVVIHTAGGLECIQKSIAHLKGKLYIEGISGARKRGVRAPRGEKRTGAGRLKANLDTAEGIQAEIERLQRQLGMS